MPHARGTPIRQKVGNRGGIDIGDEVAAIPDIGCRGVQQGINVVGNAESFLHGQIDKRRFSGERAPIRTVCTTNSTDRSRAGASRRGSRRNSPHGS